MQHAENRRNIILYFYYAGGLDLLESTMSMSVVRVVVMLPNLSMSIDCCNS
jgi:hypothetical protein